MCLILATSIFASLHLNPKALFVITLEANSNTNYNTPTEIYAIYTIPLQNSEKNFEASNDRWY